MTHGALADTLPNGFHDVEIGEIVVDFRSPRGRLKLRVLVGLRDTEQDGVTLENTYGFYFYGWHNSMYLAAKSAVLI